MEYGILLTTWEWHSFTMKPINLVKIYVNVENEYWSNIDIQSIIKLIHDVIWNEWWFISILKQ